MARDICNSTEGQTSRRDRKKIEMLFALLKRILKLDRLRLRGPNGARDEFHLAAAAQTSGTLAKLIPNTHASSGVRLRAAHTLKITADASRQPTTEFFNGIAHLGHFGRPRPLLKADVAR